MHSRTGRQNDMDKHSDAELNSLRAVPQTESEPTSEPIFILTSGQLQGIIDKALEPLQEEINTINQRLDAHSKKIYGRTESHGKKSDVRKKRLAEILVARKNIGLTYSEVGKILELGTRNGSKNTREQNMTHFGKVLESSIKEFVVTDNKTSGGKLVKLTSVYYSHLTKPKED